MTLISKRITTFLFTIVLTSLFCVGMYQWNNKYTHDTVQPSHGQLVVSEDYLEDFHYLIDGWEFYPDVLLTPESLRESADRYMVYTAIGDRTRFDGLGTRDNPHGCGTYVLHLWLPEHMQTYALELPEIYSAYKLYINGELYLQIGDPEQSSYSPRTQTKFVTFDAANRADIVISVSDYSHFYSGMVYPPAFGLPEQVGLLRDMRLGITLIAGTLGVLFALSSAYSGLRMKKGRSLLFSLLCLVTFLVPAFPLLHTFFRLPISPWYTLELISIYFRMLLILLLHNEICDTGFWSRRISVSLAAGFCVLAACYGFGAPYLTVPVMRLFSNLVTIYKLAFAAYVLITACLALRNQNTCASPLFYASTAYAVIFIWDRILPAFEPICYGWFADWGGLLLTCAIGYTMWRDLITTYIHHLAFAEEHRQMTRQLAMQREYTQQLVAQSEENRKLVHDFRHHLLTIAGLEQQIASTKETAEYQEKLHVYMEQINAHPTLRHNYCKGTFSANAAVDALLQYYDAAAEEQQISTDFQLLLPPDLPLTDVELCTILGNLLENAMEACNLLPKDASRHIRVLSRETDRLWFLLIENTYDGMIRQKDNHLLSRKGNGKHQGIGMESVREIVTHYGGNIDIYPKEHLFRVGVTLPHNTEGTIH